MALNICQPDDAEHGPRHVLGPGLGDEVELDRGEEEQQD